MQWKRLLLFMSVLLLIFFHKEKIAGSKILLSYCAIRYYHLRYGDTSSVKLNILSGFRVSDEYS